MKKPKILLSCTPTEALLGAEWDAQMAILRLRFKLPYLPMSKDVPEGYEFWVVEPGGSRDASSNAPSKTSR
jgi:hypothetical protein